MKLARIGPPGQERPVVLGADGRWRDLTSVIPDLSATALGSGALELARAALASGELPVLTGAGRFGPPVSGIGKIVCVGLNYSDHAAETGAAVPEEPVLFLKAPDTVIGPDDEVLVPRGSVTTDWEVELAVVIGRRAAYLVGAEDALSCIAGYAISHDVSEREFQLERGGQWDKGKNCATFNPFGPWLVTADEIPDPQALGLRLSVNGVRMQDGHTSNQVFGVATLVQYISQFMTLYPGDVINTGTPAGVALGRPGSAFLVAGDLVEVEIDGLGRQRQRVGAA